MKEMENLKKLVDSGGYQKVQYLSKLDEVYEPRLIHCTELESGTRSSKSLNQLQNS